MSRPVSKNNNEAAAARRGDVVVPRGRRPPADPVVESRRVRGRDGTVYLEEVIPVPRGEGRRRDLEARGFEMERRRGRSVGGGGGRDDERIRGGRREYYPDEQQQQQQRCSYYPEQRSAPQEEVRYYRPGERVVVYPDEEVVYVSDRGLPR